ncbi:MAG: tRNA (adenosine(37)-N6)-dimethylallyltransferase MiaA, partial [Flavobacteriia bacterium]
MNHKYLISVAGPTAIGKTSLSIALAKKYKTEIISCDSRQFYKEMKTGTAIPDQEELNAARHHFIQNRSVFEDYSVGDFEKDALKKLEEIFKDHSVAIMVGGSGLYADAVLKGLDDFPEIDPQIRIDLKEELKEKGIASLQESLQKMDPDTYKKIDIENPQRLIRALEICKGTGKP